MPSFQACDAFLLYSQYSSFVSEPIVDSSIKYRSFISALKVASDTLFIPEAAVEAEEVVAVVEGVTFVTKVDSSI